MPSTTVKTIDIHLQAQTAEAQAKLDKIVADTEKLKALNPEISPRLDRSAITRQLAVLQAEIKAGVDAISKDAQIEVKVKVSFLDRLAGRFAGGRNGGGIGGFLGTLLSVGGQAAAGGAGAGGAAESGAGAAAPAAAAGGLPAVTAIAAGIAGAVAAIGTGVGGIVTALTAATVSLGAFGALAIPTFSKILAGVTAVGAATTKTARDKAWDAIPKQLQPAVKSIQALQTAFTKIQTAFQPAFLKVFNDGIKIANTLLPHLLPFANAAATAIDGLLKGFNQFAGSAGFKAFLAQLLKLAGPTITIVGQGIGQVIIALGKLLLALNSGGHGLQILAGIFKGTVIFINILSFAVRNSIKNFDAMIGAFRVGAADIGHAFGNIGHAAANFGHFWAAAWDLAGRIVNDAVNLIGRGVSAIVRFFEQLPGRVTGALLGLSSSMFRIGASIISGLLHGIESGVGSILSTIGNLAGSITSTIGGLLGIHSPSTVFYGLGQNIGEGLHLGMASTLPAITGAAGTMASATIPSHGRTSGRAAVTVNQYFSVPPNVNMAELGRVTLAALQQYGKRNPIRLNIAGP